LIATNVISEAQKQNRAIPGVFEFFKRASAQNEALYLPVVTVSELRRGIALIRHRGNEPQAELLERWARRCHWQPCRPHFCLRYGGRTSVGQLRVPHPKHELDKQIAAVALVNDLAVATRNGADFSGAGVGLKNPFLPV
jgi:hypothetical protein